MEPARPVSARSRHSSLNGPFRTYCSCPSLPSSRGPSTCPCQTWSTVAALPSAGSRLAFRLEVPGYLVHILSGDRKSVVEGKSVSVRVDLGGRRLIKRKKVLLLARSGRSRCDQELINT